jgi:D-alanyl-D-alanine carboxypeptidase/D-alanyl-D-alanine-endopeptidase (penicillin-binding protein 4)
MVFTQNGNRYFTPASNTKLFTFYTGLKLLPDSLKALEYEVRGDSLIFWGTGDPSLLHPDLGNRKVYEFLKNRSESLYFSDSNFDDELLGPGWSWSDYQYYYQTEKTPFPLYGNVVRFTIQEIEQRKIAENDSGLSVYPSYFQTFLEKREEKGGLLHRRMTDNRFSYNPKFDTTFYTIEKPFHYTPELVTDLLSDTLGKKVTYIDIERPKSAQKLYSIASDTAYKRMLQPSDNFIAEQLLFVIASEIGRPLNSNLVIERMKEEHLNFLSQEPQWVDGSGLSRYNMFTPRTMIELLKAIDNEFKDDQELFHLLPAGGERGTIRNWYGAPEGNDPYVFAKTGTLSNNHALSGYLITRSGKKLYFSFMNNHYVTSSSVVKREMEKVLRYIYKTY